MSWLNLGFNEKYLIACKNEKKESIFFVYFQNYRFFDKHTKYLSL